MKNHPYMKMPSYTRWSKTIGSEQVHEVDPVVNFPYIVSSLDKVAAAGSCFAQHLGRRLKESGFNYYIPEDGHPIATEELKRKFGYGIFSARYGNIYTSRQLLQLLQRALGIFKPEEDYWLENETFLDPFRPTVQPLGFSTLSELRADRSQHLAIVKQMFCDIDYFVFTLGLTELWYDRRDGAAFPLCPGVNGGVFEPSRVGFTNLGSTDVVNDLLAFNALLLEVNPTVRLILTVSPVPLAATAVDEHVLVSTTLSKSILRVAVSEFVAKVDNAAYFPSYEIITGNFNRGNYFAQDLRSVTESGVDHVMRSFFKHATKLDSKNAVQIADVQAASNSDSDAFLRRMESVVKVLCDEEMIEKSIQS